ncbi:bifunctional 4-hydroxy-2-oxoglutarate aldolase/2-dehydro-3-deoxy-phosphogluconate aldolase [Spirillospora sp. NPDC047279]|uniref:bifunctional 4-hydroxy-2-oxoglutarate aldolase/2-dehydro-3-deoxy-phosphogluconate aldolase n=1 Tax=Spirillospora sp. NPDC047279 TaxID=3155478 RepID=UPI0033D9635C
MTYRHDLTAQITADRVIGIIRAPDAETAIAQTRRLTTAGLSTIEISLTTPGALDAVRELAGTLIGVGTVLDEHQAASALEAGAAFLVCPTLSPQVIRAAHRHGAPVVAGAATPTEIVQALEAGADLVKLFPATTYGPDGLRAIRQALPQAPLVPTGGVSPSTAPAWLAAGAVAVGMGGDLTRATTPEIATLLKTLQTP